MEIGRYIKATIGGILGGIIGILPWLLLYLFNIFNIPFLSYFLAPGVNYGYRKFKGRVNKKIKKFIIAISILIFLMVYLIIIPGIYMHDISLILKLAYWDAIKRELIISLVAAIVGVYRTVDSINYEIGLKY